MVTSKLKLVCAALLAVLTAVILIFTQFHMACMTPKYFRQDFWSYAGDFSTAVRCLHTHFGGDESEVPAVHKELGDGLKTWDGEYIPLTESELEAFDRIIHCLDESGRSMIAVMNGNTILFASDIEKSEYAYLLYSPLPVFEYSNCGIHCIAPCWYDIFPYAENETPIWLLFDCMRVFIIAVDIVFAAICILGRKSRTKPTSHRALFVLKIICAASLAVLTVLTIIYAALDPLFRIFWYFRLLSIAVPVLCITVDAVFAAICIRGRISLLKSDTPAS